MSLKKRLEKIALIIIFSCINQEKLISLILKINSIGGDIALSGEGKVIKYVKKLLQSFYPGKQYVLFDVGANKGDYSIELGGAFSETSLIYAFEPLPSTFSMLKDNVKSYSIINSYNIGMSDEKKIMPVYTNEEGSGITSVYHRRLDHFGVNLNIKQECVFTTIDDFCQENNIERIHFLKIDVEGHELSVLHGANNMLESEKIDFIQFEFGGCNIDSRTFFQDFWYLLKDRYNFYKITPIGLYPIKEYSEIREIFLCSNYLAELKEIKK